MDKQACITPGAYFYIVSETVSRFVRLWNSTTLTIKQSGLAAPKYLHKTKDYLIDMVLLKLIYKIVITWYSFRNTRSTKDKYIFRNKMIEKIICNLIKCCNCPNLFEFKTLFRLQKCNKNQFNMLALLPKK